MQATLRSYNTGFYFSTAVRVLGWVSSLSAVFAILNGSIAAYALIPAGIVTQLTHYRTEFDLEHMTYREGVRFAGMTFGKMLPLPGFDFLFLKKNRYTETRESRASMSIFKFIKYDGYLKLSDNKKLHLLQRDSKEKAMQEMEQIARDLDVELRDLTEMKI
jgi:hypothetical protein